MFIEQKKLNDPVLAGLLVLAVVVNIVLWLCTQHMQPRWANVPPAPSADTAAVSGLGDTQLAYRLLAFPLQEYGNEGGLFMPLRDYNYDRLGEWLRVLRSLDSVAQYGPYLAAYYYGGTQDPKRQLSPLIEYLALAGHDKGYMKWQWLGQAAYLAYYRADDKARGIELATELSQLPDEDLAPWARQMPVILRAKMGDRKTALGLMTSMLNEELKKKPDGNTVYNIRFMIDYICDHLQTPDEKRKNPMCVMSRGY